MFARLSSYEGSPVPREGDISRGSEEVIRQVREIRGFRGVYFLVDRATGRSKSLTLWDDEQAMLASEARATEIREQSARREGERVVSVERYEVAFGHVEP